MGIAYPVVAVLVTMVLAAQMCRHGLARKNRVPINLVTLSPVIANTVVFMLFVVLTMGVDAFSVEEWENVKGVKSVLLFAGVTAAACLFPALAVAGYYEFQKNVRDV